MKYTVFTTAALVALAAADCPNPLLEDDNFPDDLEWDDLDEVLDDFDSLDSAVTVSTDLCPTIDLACVRQDTYDAIASKINRNLNAVRGKISRVEGTVDEVQQVGDELLRRFASRDCSDGEEAVEKTNIALSENLKLMSAVETCYTQVFAFYVGNICLATRADWDKSVSFDDDDDDDDDIRIHYNLETCSSLQTACVPMLELIEKLFTNLEDALEIADDCFDDIDDDDIDDDLTDPCDDKDCKDYVCDDDDFIEDIFDDDELLDELLDFEFDDHFDDRKRREAKTKKKTERIRRDDDVDITFGAGGYWGIQEGTESSMRTTVGNGGNNGGSSSTTTTSTTNLGSTTSLPDGSGTADGNEDGNSAPSTLPSFGALVTGMLAMVFLA
eukprot:Clim_evm11s228 gene=Clim_evmTU11s228